MRRSARAPAKLNLCLDILGRRPDGYHELRTIMQSISLADTVTLSEQPEGFTLRAMGFAPQGETMEERAARAFFAAAGRPMPGLLVELEKIVPAYGGLGGGSADVASLLRLLCQAYCPSLSQEELERIGLAVGSDVPFCLRRGTVLAEGRGERLTDLPPLPECAVVVCKPDFGLSTPALFALADRANFRSPDTPGCIAALERGDLEGVAARLGNVFEEVLPEEYGEVFSIKRRLREYGALNAAMSGSGPAVFGLFREEAEARAAAEVLRQDYRETFLAFPERRP